MTKKDQTLKCEQSGLLNNELLIKELIMEIKSLKLSISNLETTNSTSKSVCGTTTSLQSYKNVSEYHYKPGDMIQITNNYNGLRGTIVQIHKVTNDRVYFFHEGKMIWRNKHNTKPLVTNN